MSQIEWKEINNIEDYPPKDISVFLYYKHLVKEKYKDTGIRVGFVTEVYKRSYEKVEWEVAILDSVDEVDVFARPDKWAYMPKVEE